VRGEIGLREVVLAVLPDGRYWDMCDAKEVVLPRWVVRWVLGES